MEMECFSAMLICSTVNGNLMLQEGEQVTLIHNVLSLCITGNPNNVGTSIYVYDDEHGTAKNESRIILVGVFTVNVMIKIAVIKTVMVIHVTVIDIMRDIARGTHRQQQNMDSQRLIVV